MIFKKYNNEKGISLVELVVAVFVFSLVVITASGIFVNAMKAQKAIVAKQNVADNLRYIMEFMVKEIRMVQADAANLDLTFNDGAGFAVKNGSFSKISFKNALGNTIVYEFDGASGEILRNDIDGGAGNQAISSEEILITGLSFRLNAWDLNSGPGAVAPFITILIKGKAKNGVGVEMQMQTSVSPRIY